MQPPQFDRKVTNLQLSIEGLLKLLGKDPKRFWEILKGITTPAEAAIWPDGFRRPAWPACCWPSPRG